MDNNGNPRGYHVAKPVCLAEFWSRLHRCIGGSGPDGCSIAWGRELPDLALSANDFRIEYLWGETSSKLELPGATKQKQVAALTQFKLNEDVCATFNSRLALGSYRSQQLVLAPAVTLDSVLYTAQRKIGRLLGHYDVREAARGVGFGPGAAAKLPRAKSDIWYKFGTQPDCNSNMIDLAQRTFAASPAWCRGLFERHQTIVTISDFNRVTTVPKNFKTDRVIAIEPLLSMFWQKGIGELIRKRLKRVGIDLATQERNQLAAFVGSVDDSLSTIDLKAASDTISYEIVRQLLPSDWFDALEQCRSQFGELDLGRDKTLVPYHKFSSMGNGYTFELETLIFWALVESVLDLTDAKDRRVLVYGDDIICPRESAQLALEVLQLCGFQANEKKTHIAGPFRESCGKHYLRGADVTPFYIRRPIDTLEELFLVHNNIQRWSARCDSLGSFPRRDGRLTDLLAWLRSFAPSKCRPQSIPDGYGDNAFIGSFDECAPKPFRQNRCSCNRKSHDYVTNGCNCPIGWDGWRGYHYPKTPLEEPPDDELGAYIASLWRLEHVKERDGRSEFRTLYQWVAAIKDQARTAKTGASIDSFLGFYLPMDGYMAIVKRRLGPHRRKRLCVFGAWADLGQSLE